MALRQPECHADRATTGLDDLCVRFIINLPEEDLSSVARICFQVEEAQWFYEDFIRPLDPTLPSMTLRTFCLRIFQHCPLLASFSTENHTKAFEEFLEYKTRVPVRGAILLNEAMDSTVLVKGWKKGANWSFPRGKINKDEDDLDCAVREVYEETGLDLREAGLVPTESRPKYIEISMREQHMRLYVFRDVPMDTNFEPRTRKEISKIQWYKLSELPAFRKRGGQNQEPVAVPNANKFYMVAPFLVPLKKWVVSQKKIEARRAASGAHAHLHTHQSIDEIHTEDDWANTDTAGEFNTRTPGIDTIDGATLELQRLLKVQPPTQGLQPALTPQDKGSALLSILQSKGNASQQPARLPHTPLDHTLANAPQPQTPHHHNHHHMPTINTQQPPPTFPLLPNQGVSWNTPPFQAGPAQSYQQPYPHPVQQQFENPQPPIMYSQPLPPHLQHFNMIPGQQAIPGNFMGAPQIYVNQQPGQHQGAPGQVPIQGSMPMANLGPAQLSGQSIALLNAFKSGGAGQQKENVRLPQAPPMPVPQHHLNMAYAHAELPHSQAPMQPQVVPVAPVAPVPDRAPVSPQELAGTNMGPPANDHRSALLGMFQKAEPKAAASQHVDQGFAAGPSPMNTGGPPSRASLDTNLAVSLDSLSFKARPDATAELPQAPGNYAPQHMNQPASARQPSQQIRILQRGQTEAALGLASQPGMSPNVSPYISNSQPASGTLSSPSTAPIPMAPDGRPQSSNDQKRQLLSLFGNKRQSPASLEVAKGRDGAGEVPRSRVTSLASGMGEPLLVSAETSRRGSQTPISPANRSFLLGYLDSVNNNATR